MAAPNDVVAEGVSPVATFRLLGEAVSTLRKRLDPALPKKHEERASRARIEVEPGKARFRIAGAAVEVAAEASAYFVAEMPFLELKSVLVQRFADDAKVSFAFENGSFTVCGVTSRSKQIVLDPLPPSSIDGLEAERAPVVDQLDVPIGLPLVAAYLQTRRYGLNPLLPNRRLRLQQDQVEGLLDVAASLLRPLGVTREDLIALVDRKIGGV